ncbi:hypothetical protein M9Y10_041380 [Tritrichomonas musculus]|uniref:Uncharacterized protein n=1 Tax=Tritrichomonas musculus TaxID=1915356 RepID=A0ABR2K468_9EUKA
MKRMMIAVKNPESFEVDIDDDDEKQYAFVRLEVKIIKMTKNETNGKTEFIEKVDGEELRTFVDLQMVDSSNTSIKIKG